MPLRDAAPQACRFKPIYHLLVALYFFRHVSLDRDFVADFAHPIDGTLAAFLQALVAENTLLLDENKKLKRALNSFIA